jgi:hypothetical protein
MRLYVSVLCSFALLCLTGCSNNSASTKNEEARVVPAGDKAAAGHLTYNVVDSQIFTQLGDEASPSIPHDRFLVVQINVTNSSNVDNPIPSVELVSDAGKTYSELTDGTGVTNWLGIVRHVGPGQTERGQIVFDAPAAHYKLRFSDETNNTEILADLPLSYAHEKVDDALIPTTELPDVTGPTGGFRTKAK